MKRKTPLKCFKKGNIPWNKGKHVQTNTGKTHFKKGEHPSILTEFKKGEHVGEKHPNWKGGIRKYKDGYLAQYNPNHPNVTKNKVVLQHRLIMEKKIGRPLSEEEVVHHIDGDTSNNDIKNLMLFKNNTQHLNFHSTVSRIYKNQFKENYQIKK